MNYIKQLQADKQILLDENKALIEGYNELRQYLNLDKFGKDIMVNKNDILLRINEIVNQPEIINSLIANTPLNKTWLGGKINLAGNLIKA